MPVITAEQAGSSNITRFLDLIAYSEGTADNGDDGYNMIVTGSDGRKEFFTDYSDHPFAKGRTAKVIRHVPLLASTAAGRYQLLLRYWRSYQTMLDLPDFSPLSQDKVAIRQIHERGALIELANGDVESAIKLCSNLWASLPGNDYAQGGHSMQALLEHWIAGEQPASV
jgi:muramidase (phage lysozyme)